MEGMVDMYRRNGGCVGKDLKVCREGEVGVLGRR